MAFFNCGNLIILSGIASEAIAKAQTHHCNNEVKPANPFLILRRPGNYA
ncbi:MAG: hypothetical protein V7K68_14590 [Nostoc sp.]